MRPSHGTPGGATRRCQRAPSVMKRGVVFLLVAALGATAGALAERHLRLGRDMIFHSSDVEAFELPNGRLVRTNTWYDRSDLLDAGQEFYAGANGLAIMEPEAGTSLDGFATITDEGGGAPYLRITKTNTTVAVARSAKPVGAEPQPAEQGAVAEPETDGYTEWWVCRQDAPVATGQR
jgi:hypothetical protein